MQAHEPRGLREIDDELWVAEDGLRYVVEMGRRMTVIRLPSGELFVHSPMSLDDELCRQLAELGAVRFVLPASNLHGHLTMGDYRDAYPDAQLFAVAGLADKRSDLDFDGELPDDADPGWSDVLEWKVLRGVPKITEVVFFHRPTRTLVVGDTCFNTVRTLPSQPESGLGDRE